jgi:hypothetical protein
VSEHYTKTTKECEGWCPSCNRMTIHRVDGGRKGPCIDAQHGDPTRTDPGIAQFRVVYLDKDTWKRKQQDFVVFDEALSFFRRHGGSEICTLWKTSTKPHLQLR